MTDFQSESGMQKVVTFGQIRTNSGRTVACHRQTTLTNLHYVYLLYPIFILCMLPDSNVKKDTASIASKNLQSSLAHITEGVRYRESGTLVEIRSFTASDCVRQISN